jgi:hypothetical protein
MASAIQSSLSKWKGFRLKNILAAFRLVLADITKLTAPTTAAVIAAIAAPVLAKILGAAITPVEVVGWLAIVYSSAAALEKLISGKAAADVRRRSSK